MIRALLAIALAGCAAQAVVPIANVSARPGNDSRAAAAQPRSVAKPPQGSGVITGTVRDKHTGDPMAGATIVALSQALHGEQVVVVEDNGRYEITGLPSGRYELTIYYDDFTFKRSHISVVSRSVTGANLRLDQDAAQRQRLAELAAARRKAQLHPRPRHP